MRLTHTQDWNAETPNGKSVVYVTLSIDGSLDDARRSAVDELVRRGSGRAVWRTGSPTGRSYALLELPNEPDAGAIAAATGARVYESAIIALAVFPAVREALPSLLETLAGPGRPAGILACKACEGGVVIEWDPQRSSSSVVLGVVDVELRRFNSARTAELLSPLPPASLARIAADGLQAEQVAPDRVLEVLIERAGLTVDSREGGSV
jgi:hypothetical protein